ncbi:MAG: tetratricopeptide repeat protein [Rhodospirillales bacterium]|nr:tetratricopeptide repeat protein [Rhodospirillales bacterium]
MVKRPKGTAEDLFPKAVGLFQAGKLAAAEKICRKILARHPDHGDTLNLFAMARAHGGNFESAVNYLQRAVKSNPLNPAYHSNLGEILGASGNFEAAKSAFTQALALQPDHAGHLANLGTANLHLGIWPEAVAALQSAASLDPNNATVFARLGVAMQESRQLQAAVDAYQTAGRLGLQDPQTCYNLGTVLARLDDLDAAIGAFRQAVQLDTSYQPAYRSLGNIYLKRADYADAVEMLEQAIALQPGDMEVLQDLGSSLIGVENYEKAISIYQQLVNLKPDSVSQRADLAFANLCAGNPEAALQASSGGLDLKANDTSCLAFKATALNHLERREEAGYLLDFERLIYQKQFTAPVGFASIEAFNEALFAHVKNHTSLKDSKLNRGLVAGQGTQELFVGEITPVLKAFQTMINAAIEGYKQAVPVDASHPFLLSQPSAVHVTCWATLFQSSGFMDTHFHPPGWLSGVYYPQLPDAVDKRSDAHQGWIEFGRAYYRIASTDTPPVHLIKPSPGLMVLFPSYFGHRTIPFESSQERMSVAFDILPRG